MASDYSTIAERWKELSGDHKWEDLLDPLDIDLRRYIIHYGEMSQAAYDAFNTERVSKYAGDCRYSMKNLFASVGLTVANPFKYEPTKYLYATSRINLPESILIRSLSREAWNKESNWIGYIAVATDEGKVVLGRRDIVVAWRGTNRYTEAGTCLDYPLVSAAQLLGVDPDPMVHEGWLSLYTSNDPLSQYNKLSVRDQILDELKRLMDKYKDEEISLTLTGHSLGGALSTLCGADIVVNGFNRIENRPEKCPATVFAFGCPNVGGQAFKNIFDSTQDVRVLRITNIPDAVPLVPPIEFGYRPVGKELRMDSRKSFYLKPGNLFTWHDMEQYLHAVAGTQGERDSFRLDVKRDITLANKGFDVLKDKYLVPGSWWCEKNKFMVQQKDGSWQLEDHQI